MQNTNRFYNKLLKGLTVIIVLLMLAATIARGNYPNEVEAVLVKSGKNKVELEKAIRYFQRGRDSLKLKALYFLVSNMDIHYSINYYWADSTGKRVPFNELAFPNFEASLKGFDDLKQKVKVHPVPIQYADIDSIKSTFLIDNVNRAFESWAKPWAKHLTFDEFCEFILPYRIYAEPLEFWRPIYQQRFGWVADSVGQKPMQAATRVLNNNLKSWFINTYNIEVRKEPLPNLSSLQLLFRKQGLCQDATELTCLAMRSQGIPCAPEMVTYWATSSGSHYWNVTLDENHKLLPFNGADRNIEEFNLLREPGKVIRITYRKQANTLASQISVDQIPEGFMRLTNYVDVTEHYWPVTNIKCSLFANETSPKTVYACVFNYLEWKPTFWGTAQNDTVQFPNMAKGVVYLPMYFVGNELLPAGYPLALSYNKQQTFEPDTLNKRTIHLPEQEKYLIYRPGKKYTLFYCGKGWRKVDEKIADNSHMLTFDKVPDNALLVMVPEYSVGKERPFIITEDGKRVWW